MELLHFLFNCTSPGWLPPVLLAQTHRWRPNAIRSPNPEATARKHPEDYDLVITEMTMPNMTGSELAHRIMTIRADVPIILGAGFIELINEEKAKALGIRGCIMKPVVIKNLAQAVRRVQDKS